LIAIKGITGKAHYPAGARYIAKLGCQIKQAYLVFDDVLLKTTHGVTPLRLRAQFDKDFATSIKPSNPAFGKALLSD
jgi:hypothetical protein